LNKPTTVFTQIVKSVENRFCKVSATNFIGRMPTEIMPTKSANRMII